jgi:4'-phosphopantetheinyl transferase
VVRTVLSKYAPISPKEWRFSFNAYGRPAIANVTIAASGLTFNVSHTKDLILLAITENRHLGVDVENAIARAEVLDLARRYFAPEETAALLGLPQELVQRAFLDIWTLKESYVKARGLGLSIPLDEFFFRKGQTGDITFHIGSRLSDHALHWQFWQFQPKSPHIIAVCAENREIVTSFVVRTIIPGFFDEPLNIQPIGASTYRQKPDTRSECGSCQRGSGG